MRIKHSSPDLLILEDIPWMSSILMVIFVLIFSAATLFAISQEEWLGLFFLTGVVLGIGGLIAVVRRTMLTLSRADQSIEIRQRSLLGDHRVTHDLRDLEGAVLQTTDSHTATHRAALVLKRGTEDRVFLPIKRVYSNEYAARLAADAVNDWLDQVAG